MKQETKDPHSPAMIEAAVAMVRRMTPEEALAFLTYRTPGVEETDMTGMFSNGNKPEPLVPAEPRVAPV